MQDHPLRTNLILDSCSRNHPASIACPGVVSLPSDPGMGFPSGEICSLTHLPSCCMGHIECFTSYNYTLSHFLVYQHISLSAYLLHVSVWPAHSIQCPLHMSPSVACSLHRTHLVRSVASWVSPAPLRGVCPPGEALPGHCHPHVSNGSAVLSLSQQQSVWHNHSDIIMEHMNIT